MPYKDPRKKYLKNRGWLRRNPEKARAWKDKNKQRLRGYAKKARRKAYFSRHGYYPENAPARPSLGMHPYEYIATLKATTPCFDCKNSFPPYVMDFDHVRGKKKYLISSLAAQNVGVKTFLEEIAKCDIVCANCHRIRTFKKKPPRYFPKQIEKTGSG
jgi:hypothetical protein